MTKPGSPVVVALDLSTAEEAVRLARKLEPYVGAFKVGLGLLMGPGPGVVAALTSLDRPVVVDAKLHDIPSTVATSIRHLGHLGARWVTVHASGGRATLEAAVESLAAGAQDREAGVLAVTVLTSLDDAALAEAGVPASVGRLTARLSRLAAEAGCEGVVCSPRELAVVADVAPELLRVTPGIRMANSERHDQNRVATPEAAIRHGADLIVVGRAITAAADPVRAAAELAERVAAHSETQP